MLQQASRVLFSRLALQNAAAAGCTCLQQVQGTGLQQHSPHHIHQTRSKSTTAGSFDGAADAQQTSAGWGWFGSGTTAATGPSTAPILDIPADAGAAAAAAVAAAPTPPATVDSAADLISQADVLVDVSSAAADAAVAAAYADVWTGTRLFMEALMWTHDGLQLPWFEAIVATNLLVRLCSLPLTISIQRLSPVMASMRADTQRAQELSTKLSKATSAGEYAEQAQALQTYMEEFNQKYKGKRRNAFLNPVFGLLQAVVFVSQFSAIGTLANHKVPSMTHEGALWFTNLTVPDPLWLLPIICGITTLAQVHTKRFQDAMVTMGGQAAFMKPFMSFMALVIVVIGQWQPSAIALLWATNSVIASGQNALLSNAGVRKVLGLPDVAAAAAATAAAKPAASSSGDSQGLLQRLFGGGASSQPKSTGVPAAAVGAPPPGTPVATNYLPSRPRRRVKH